MNEAVTPIAATPYHEAGHAVAARALGLVVERVTIEPVFDTFYGRTRLGTTQIKIIGDHTRDRSPEMRQRLRAEAIALLAGAVAERFAQGHVALGAGDIDVEQARWLLSQVTPPSDLPLVLRAAQSAAERLVRQRWSQIEKLAARLTRSRTLIRRSRDA